MILCNEHVHGGRSVPGSEGAPSREEAVLGNAWLCIRNAEEDIEGDV